MRVASAAWPPAPGALQWKRRERRPAPRHSRQRGACGPDGARSRGPPHGRNRQGLSDGVLPDRSLTRGCGETGSKPDGAAIDAQHDQGPRAARRHRRRVAFRARSRPWIDRLAEVQAMTARRPRPGKENGADPEVCAITSSGGLTAPEAGSHPPGRCTGRKPLSLRPRPRRCLPWSRRQWSSGSAKRSGRGRPGSWGGGLPDSPCSRS